jgi:hypothetical protein
MIQRTATLLVAAGLIAAAAGCGGSGDDKTSAEPSPSRSASPAASATPTATPPTTPPSTSPSRPPNTPTDTVVAPGWVVGTATAASTGPCYGLVTDDGTEYALHSSAGFAVRKGERIRVRIDRLALKIYCGPGAPAAVKEHETIG